MQFILGETWTKKGHFRYYNMSKQGKGMHY